MKKEEFINIKGSFDPIKKFIKPFAETVLMPLKPLVDPLERLADFMFRLGNIIGIFKTFIEYVKNILYYITDPIKMVTDLYYGFITGILLIYDYVTDFIFGKARSTFNYRNINVLNKNQGFKNKKLDCSDPNSTCYSPSIVTIILLVLCPPLAMLFTLGLKAIIHIIIACLLTYFFYFPGLIYASLFVL